MAAIIRLKRKACDEPAEGLVIALKKAKCELSDKSEVIFKFAATLNNEKESIRDHIQAALSKEKDSKVTKWRDPKNIAISENKIKNLREKMQAEHKSANDKKKLDYLNNRRLILSEEFQDLEDSSCKGAEIRKLFHLYDIIEENEDVKKQNEVESTITCNDIPLIREKVDDYVTDIYYVEGQLDPTFVDRMVDVRRLSLSNEQEIYFGSSDSEELYEDEEDSNDENHWRNDYPDEDSRSEKDQDSESDRSDSYSEDYDVAAFREKMEMTDAFRGFDIDEADDEFEESDCVRKASDYRWASDDGDES